MPTTIADVARAAGVGIGTVSRVLNGSPLVSHATRQRVLAVVERLGYRPSPIARAFGRRSTHRVEVIVPLFAAPLFLEVLRGAEAAFEQSHYALVPRTVGGPDERARAFDECCNSGRSDGALLVWMAPTEGFVERVTYEGFPAVLLNVVEPRLWCVAVDHAAAARQAVTYCLGLGHRRVALVDRVEDPYDPASEGVCGRGFHQAVAAAGLSTPAEYDRLAEFSMEGGADALDALTALPEPPTAVVVGSDAQAVGVVQAAAARGWRVPGDLSVVGYSDSEFAQLIGLTTIQVPLREIGRRAAEVLLSAMADSGTTPGTTYLPTQLLVRRTCGPPQ